MAVIVNSMELFAVVVHCRGARGEGRYRVGAHFLSVGDDDERARLIALMRAAREQWR